MNNLIKEILEKSKGRILEEYLIKEILKKVVETLISEGKTVSTMESCTGGGLDHHITNIPGASSVIRLGLTTYSNIGKIEVGGVPAETIEKYTVYSMETAIDMARMAVTHLNDNYGVGITGQLKTVDPCNPYGASDKVHISVYDAEKEEYYNKSMIVTADNREENKTQVIHEVSLMLLQMLNNTKDISVVVECDDEKNLYDAKLELEPLGIKVYSTKDLNIKSVEGKNTIGKAETIYDETYNNTGKKIPIIVWENICYNSMKVTYYDGKNFYMYSKIHECAPLIIKNSKVNVLRKTKQ